MKTHSEKTQETTNRPVAQSVPPEHSGGEAAYQFSEKRPEALTQRKIQTQANNSPRVAQLRSFHDMVNGAEAAEPIQLQPQTGEASVEQAAKPNRTGLPDRLKQGVENLSGISVDDVKVHRNSSKPAQLQAHAFAQGSQIHLGPGQERHHPTRPRMSCSRSSAA